MDSLLTLLYFAQIYTPPDPRIEASNPILWNVGAIPHVLDGPNFRVVAPPCHGKIDQRNFRPFFG